MAGPDPRDRDKSSVLRRAAGRARRSLRGAVCFALANAAITVAIVACSLTTGEVAWTARVNRILVVFAFAGGTGGFLSWTLSATVAGARVATARFAALFATLPVAVVGVLWATIFALTLATDGPGEAYWFSRAFAIDMFYKAATPAYIIAVSALPLMMPAAVVQLIAAAAMFARHPRG